jgi:hypothetical protein
LNTTGKIVSVEDLTQMTVSPMFELMARYFADLDRKQFESDLAEKDDVLLIYAGDELVGFSTMQIREEGFNGSRVQVLFSGDTIIDSRYWNTHELQRGFVRRASRALRESELPLYWFLICGGYRTYRYLPIFFHEFWPRHDRATPQGSQEMMDFLAGDRFGDSYQNGVVVTSNGRLREDVSPIEKKHLKNPHVAFFDEANPGHLSGHELVCLAKFSEDNMTRALLKLHNGKQQQ